MRRRSRGSTDGRAIVFSRGRTGCGTGWKPGLYLVSPDGKQKTMIAPATSPNAPIERSIEPRTAGAVTAAAAP